MKKDTIFLLSAVIFFCALLFPPACTEDPVSREQAKIKELIKSYNFRVITAAQTGDTKPLEDIASKAVLTKLSIWIAAWRDSDLYMDAQLKKLKFGGIKLSEKQALATTSEEWDYEYKNVNDKRTVLPKTHIAYEMEYTVSKVDKKGQESNWIITAISVKSEKREEIKSKGQS